MNYSSGAEFFEKLKNEDVGAPDELKKIDKDCKDCLYEAAKLTEKDVLEAVITNELTEFEQIVVRLHWFKNISLNQIAALYGVPRENVRRSAEKSKDKIYRCMKYIILYNLLIDGRKSVPDDFHFKIVRCIDGKELIS